MTTEFTKGQKKRYFEKGGNECPLCLSTNITTIGNPIRDDGDGMCRQQMQCLICKKEWKDVFRRFDIESISEPDELSNVKQFIGAKPKGEEDGK